jgi:hypothetical protein
MGAYLPNGSTLKATTVIFNNEVCRTFTAMSSRTLLSDQISISVQFQSTISNGTLGAGNQPYTLLEKNLTKRNNC